MKWDRQSQRARAALKRWRRYVRLGLRLLLPSRVEARRAARFRQSGLFDRDWYLSCYPRLPWICRCMPERHYVLVGEQAGLCPSAKFSPRAYRHLNPEISLEASEFEHYLENGRTSGALTLDLPAGDAAPVFPPVPPGPHPSARFAVVLHLHYRDMWEEFSSRLRQSGLDLDLFVIITAPFTESDAATAERIRADFPKAQLLTMPNHGRDILPFLHLARSGVLAPYEAVLKLHSKRSPHREDGEAWRDALVSGVLGSGEKLQASLERFLTHPKAGIWVADGHRLSGIGWWGPNRARAGLLLNRIGINLPNNLSFAAGSIYWLSRAMVARLAALPIDASDFEPEMGQVDGTTAHALERAFGEITRASDLEIFESHELMS